jgi:hypothetical protein
VLTALLLLLAPAAARAQENLQLVEQEIKAGLLYNFLKYTAWPQDRAPAPNAPIIVCLLGGDPFAGRLQPMAGRTVNQRTIQLRNLQMVEDAEPCSLLFVHADEKPQWGQLSLSLAARPMLTVSDFPGFADAGGMIEFTRAGNRIGVKINAGAVAAAHLQVEDRLLRLANPVRGGTGP